MISALMGTILRSLLLGIAVAIALAALRVRSPHLKKSAWTAVLVSAFVMPVFMRGHGPVIQAPSYVVTLTPGVIVPAVSSAMRPSITTIYGVVTLLMLARYALSLTRLMRIRRKARCVVAGWAAGLDVRAAGLSSPATFGSTILLPEEYVHWSARKRAAIMAHERSHVIAHDCQWLWLAKFYKCLFWINPLAWWLEHRIAALAEETSDAAALQAVGDAPAYAEILLEFAAAGRQAPTDATGIGRPGIATRIERIVDGNAAADEPRMWCRFAAGAVVMPAMLLCATLQLASSHRAFAYERLAVGGRSSQRGSAAGTPRVLGWPAVHQLIQFYPPEARRAGIDGLVTLAVGLDGTGRVTDTRVLGEDPRNFGFGIAASAVAHVMKYSNPTGRAAQLKFRIRFALHHEHPSARPPR